MAAVSLLAPPPSVGHASTVLEWLGLLGLLELEGKFAGYSLKKISTLWDIELTSVGVGMLGGGVVFLRRKCLYLLGRGGGVAWLQEAVAVRDSGVAQCTP